MADTWQHQPGGTISRRSPDPAARGVVITGMGVTSAFGRGSAALLDRMLTGEPAFAPVTRFEPARCRATAAAELPGAPVLADELVAVIEEACGAAGIGESRHSESRHSESRHSDRGHGDHESEHRGWPLLLALHSDPFAARDPGAGQAIGTVAADVARRTGLADSPRTYTTACVAASTATADAAAMITAERLDRAVVAAGYLVEADSFGLFDAGRVLATDGKLRPFSRGRRGMLLGDGVAAVVLESAASARKRGAHVLASLAGWGRAGDAFHVCQPRPDGSGLARAIDAALRRARVGHDEVGYINASGAGTPQGDAAEAAGLHRAFGQAALRIPVSSTKSTHGHALEASGLLELIATVLALRGGQLPVNAGFLAPDEECELDLVLGTPRQRRPRYALSVNSAFGGANTALLVGAA
jgi:3-oxoacyl-[acyl-carrier-protein] synthase II